MAELDDLLAAASTADRQDRIAWRDPLAAHGLQAIPAMHEWLAKPELGAFAVRVLGPGIPKSDFWASAKEGIDQVGCGYTAQGVEFDYVGVIFGPDLVYRPMDGGWVGQGDQSSDRVVRSGVTDAECTDFVKSTYRVLLTRGLRGCYVYFMGAPTRDFFLSRVERSHSSLTKAAESTAEYETR